ncbi:MAG: hypothetical protein DRP93_07570 [Candidatus Neomarinimicrobiota bacterium]|nr:MAG: hypothetical protein DRP93_07570 [Candidatus Neomarinimicrobiota bacterium]
MVTDLNPSPEQCAKLHDLTVGTNVSLQLLDHHASGQAMADHYDWYYLDSTKSATSIVAEWLGLDRTGDKYIKTLVAATNAADIFLTEDELFPLGRVLADFVFSAKEIPAMVGFKREYLIDTLTYMVEEYFDHGHVELEENLLRMKKEILIEEGSTSVMTLKDVVVKRLGAIIMESHYNYTLMLGGASVCITYDAPYPSDLANRITDNYEQFNLFINISKAGGVSVRSNDHIDSSVVARDLFGGGGHPKASGGFIKNLPEFFSYEDVKKFLVKNYAFTEK